MIEIEFEMRIGFLDYSFGSWRGVCFSQVENVVLIANSFEESILLNSVVKRSYIQMGDSEVIYHCSHEV